MKHSLFHNIWNRSSDDLSKNSLVSTDGIGGLTRSNRKPYLSIWRVDVGNRTRTAMVRDQSVILWSSQTADRLNLNKWSILNCRICKSFASIVLWSLYWLLHFLSYHKVWNFPLKFSAIFALVACRLLSCVCVNTAPRRPHCASAVFFFTH